MAGVAAVAMRAGVPAIAFCGQVDAQNDVLRDMGLAAAFSIMNKPMPLVEATTRAALLLEDCVRHVFAFHAAAKEKINKVQNQGI